MANLIDRLVEGVGAGGADRFDRARLLVLGSIAAGLTACIFVVHRFVLLPEPELQHLNMAGITAFMLCTPLILRATGSVRVAAHAMLLALSAAVFVDATQVGGVSGPPVFAMLVVPLMATFFLGRMAGASYGLLQGVSLVGLAALQLNDVLPGAPEAFTGTDTHMIAGLGILAFITVFSMVYESERERAVARTTSVVDSLADGVVAVDPDGRVLVANEPAAALLGLDALRPGQSVTELADGLLAELVVGAWRSDALVEQDLELPDGRRGKARSTPIRLPDGRSDGAVLILRDVTLEHAVDKMKTDFIATVSHELRTPMTSVLGFAKLIQGQLDKRLLPALDPDDAKAARAAGKVRKNVQVIITEGERLTALINDVLDIAKMESGRMEWHMAAVDPAALVQRASEATAGLFEGTPVALETEVAPDLPALHGDSHRLLQVLINLVSNASKFTESGSVRIVASPHGDGVCFAVHDTGPGIPADSLQTIFERFQQARDPITDKPRGTGLGLAICREIAAAHGGSLSVESTLGEGSCFSLIVPPREGSMVPDKR